MKSNKRGSDKIQNIISNKKKLSAIVSNLKNKYERSKLFEQEMKKEQSKLMEPITEPLNEINRKLITRPKLTIGEKRKLANLEL